MLAKHGWKETRRERGKGETCTRVTGVGIGLGGALGDFEGILGDDLVQGILAAAEEFAGIAMAGKRGQFPADLWIGNGSSPTRGHEPETPRAARRSIQFRRSGIVR